jgi:hypothetical protein
MGDHQVTVDRLLTVGKQMLPETVRASAAIEDQQRAIIEPDLDTRGIAAVAERGRPRLRERATGAPEANPQGKPPRR